MRHPGGQLADGRQLLRLQQLAVGGFQLAQQLFLLALFMVERLQRGLQVLAGLGDGTDVVHQQTEAAFAVRRLEGKEQGALQLPLVFVAVAAELDQRKVCLLYTSPSPRDRTRSRMPSSA